MSKITRYALLFFFFVVVGILLFDYIGTKFVRLNYMRRDLQMTREMSFAVFEEIESQLANGNTDSTMVHLQSFTKVAPRANFHEYINLLYHLKNDIAGTNRIDNLSERTR